MIHKTYKYRIYPILASIRYKMRNYFRTKNAVEVIKSGQSETSLYLFGATEAAKDALRKAGFSICVCCNDAKLLRISASTKSVHGAGRGCENECAGMRFEKCFVCEMADEIRYKHNISVYHDVDELISAIKHKSNNSH